MSDGSWRSAPGWPDVDVVMPIRNEGPHLTAAHAAIRAQNYPGSLRIFMGIGPSDDDTNLVAHELAAVDPCLVVVDNPSGSIPAALNLAIGSGSAPVIVRVDGHSELTDDYIERAVTTMRRTGAINVGGMQVPVGATPFEKAVAAATTSWLGTGGAAYRVGGLEAEVDTVFLGVFDRTAIEAAGLFNEQILRNEDYELNIRLRAAGGKIVFDPELSVRYTPRGSWRMLAGQYFQYGVWKATVMRLHPRATKLRQLIPPIGIVGVIAGTTLGFRWRPALAVPALYATTVGAAAFGSAPNAGTRARVGVVIATMHLSWVVGLFRGLSPFRSRGS